MKHYLDLGRARRRDRTGTTDPSIMPESKSAAVFRIGESVRAKSNAYQFAVIGR